MTRRLVAGAACALVAAALAPAAALAAGVQITATPGLTPSFKRTIPDYVSRCKSGQPLAFSVTAPAGDTVGVDGAKARSGSFTKSVSLTAGQATTLVVTVAGKRTTHHVRCLPASFPHWTFQRPGKPRAQWYLFAPSIKGATGPYTNDVIVIDGNGVPVWWRRAVPSPFNSIWLGNGLLGWTRWYGDHFGMRPSSAWEIHRLDGTRVRTLRTVGTPTDTHDMEPLPNGDFMLISYRLRHGVDLTQYGGSGTGNVVDGELQEIAPSGDVVWQWDSNGNVLPSETTTRPPPADKLPNGQTAYDVFHLNSVSPDSSGGYVISARHTDAVFRIDKATGAVTWKLGGTTTAQSLTVLGDPLSPHLAKQHDARVLPDGTISVYDNRSKVGPPRAVRFKVDPLARTATWLEQVTDPNVQASGAEGSARRIAGGDWVVSWGETPVLSELTASNKLVWRLTLKDGLKNYRVTPIAPGQLSAAALRAAMDAQFPRK